MIQGKVISAAIKNDVFFLAVEVPPEHIETLMALISTGYNVQFPVVLPKDKAAKLREEWQKHFTGPAGAGYVELKEVTDP